MCEEEGNRTSEKMTRVRGERAGQGREGEGGEGGWGKEE